MKHQLSTSGILCIYLYYPVCDTLHITLHRQSIRFFHVLRNFFLLSPLSWFWNSSVFYKLILENIFHVLLHVFERHSCQFSFFPSFSLSFSLPLTILTTVTFLLVSSFCFCKLFKKQMDCVFSCFTEVQEFVNQYFSCHPPVSPSHLSVVNPVIDVGLFSSSIL